MPKVSILIPAYNVEKYLPQCLDSILNQTYRDMQIVVIDDGSKDATWNVMQEYATKDERFEIYHQENQGVAETRNRLLAYSKGDWILFVDADDWLETQMIAYMIGVAENRGVEVVVCGHVMNNAVPSDKWSEEVFETETLIREFLKHTKLRGQLWNKLIQGKVARSISFSSEIGYGEDALFCWNAFQRVSRLFNSTRELYHYRLNNNSISASLFGPTKMSAHYVWDEITQDVAQNWPEFVSDARARWCMEDVLLLRSSAQSKCPKTKDVSILQESIKKNYRCFVGVNFIPLKWKLYAFFVKRVYSFARI